jgi:hypothetical protein
MNVSPAQTAPWSNPPQRSKPLRRRRAERLARRAEFWGDRLTRAAQEGPEAVAAVQWDRARTTLSRLPPDQQDKAWEALAAAIDRVRETHAQ